ncbi:MAG TPA: SRPBCC family protein, partial [Jatrophihabitantaceae bacterium]|nr:SRPBCC family protein [Jatrophihabitantaceae bacterium]
MAGEAGFTDNVKAPADKIIEALTDFDSIPEWQSAVMECEVLDRDAEGRGSRIRMKVDAKIRKVDYIVRYSYDLPNGFSWEQESGDLKENTGVYRFTPKDDGSTDVTVDIVAEVGF